MIHVYDDDERQVTDIANYAMNHGSFAEVAINMNKALKRLGVYADPDDAEWVGMCASLNSGFKYKNKKSFIMHVWETTSLPVFVWHHAQKQRVFGLSNQITKLWHKYGRTEVKTVYGGCDTDFWQQTIPKNKNQFQFFHVNSTNIRSGIDLTVHAFAMAFATNPNVKLLIKDTNPQGDSSPLARQIKSYVDKYQVNIEYHTKRESMLWVRDRYSESHVTLNMLRATSFGMPLLECGACDSLCVTGDIEPTNELVTSEHGILLKPKGMVKLNELIGPLETNWGLLNCYGRFPHIEEPYIADFSVEEYAILLQEIYNNWDKYSKIDKRGPIVRDWSWDRSAKVLKEQLYGV
jgi:glycosyltransferase involved in cell wall biosynthesis